MADTETETSATLRSQGNDFFRQGNDVSVNSAVRSARYEKAMALYERARDAATTNEDRSSAAKNLCVAAKKILPLLAVSYNLEKMLHYFMLGVDGIVCALEDGSECKSVAWLKGSQDQFANLLQVVLSLDAHRQIRTRFLWRLVRDVAHDWVLANTYFTLAVMEFNESVVLLEDGDFKRCFGLLNDASMPLERACSHSKKCGGLTCLRTDIHGVLMDDLRSSVAHHLVLSEARIQLNIAAAMYQQYVFDEEELNMDILWDIADRFKSTMVTTRELDLETEAKAAGRLGVLMHKCFKLPSGKVYLNRSVSLVSALSNRHIIQQEAWFVESRELLQQIQAEARRHQDEKEAAERKPYLDKLKPQLDAMNAADGSSITLLKHVYEKHKPRNYPDYVLTIDTDSNIKSLLQKSIVHYHPDKVMESQFETKDEWMTCKVLYSEIVKRLTNKYQSYK